ncbi:Glutamine synthetase [Fragilaria crotonensis]|nr:Glutamine synthetase [Fragilaria crotonensis]
MVFNLRSRRSNFMMSNERRAASHEDPVNPCSRPTESMSYNLKRNTNPNASTMKDATSPSQSAGLRITSPDDYRVSQEQLARDSNTALLRALKVAGVQFVRYITVDSSNNIRCKAVPLKRLRRSNTLQYQVSIAEACFGGLPAYGDGVIPGSTVDASRVLIVNPDISTIRVLPYADKTAMVIGSLHDPSDHSVSPLCSRGLLARVIDTASAHHGIAFQVGAELEFSLVRDEGELSDGQLPKPVDSSVFANPATLNDQEGFISDLCVQLEEQDIEIELVHAESAPGQLEVVLAYLTNVMTLADHVVYTKETIRSVARKHNLRALFLPKINSMQAGNGLHLHFSFRELNSSTPKDNAFFSKNQIGAPSAQGGAFIEGILKHLPSLLALTIPSVNSFRRVGKGCWTGHSVSWNTEDKESPLRVCLDLESGEASNVEMKMCDSMANIHLALAVVLSAGLDGIVNNLTLRPCANDAHDPLPVLPTSFSESLDILEADPFIVSILGSDLLKNYVAHRRAEVAHASKMTLEDEVVNAYNKA